MDLEGRPARDCPERKERRMTKTTVLKVEGMTCGHCEMSVQEALDELDGVRASRADRNTGDVEVTYEEGRVTDEQFRQAVGEAGYALKS